MNEAVNPPSNHGSSGNSNNNPFSGVLYRFEKKKWVKTDEFHPTDVVIVRDEVGDKLYYFEGEDSSALDHQNSKLSLVQFKNRYPDLQIVRIDSLRGHENISLPKEVLIFLNSHYKR